MAIMTSPECLRYQFTPQYKKEGVKLSDKCCYKLKKETALKWENENNKHIAITGIRGEEGGMRALNGCTIFEGDNLKKFHPLKVVSKEWELEFIKRNNIKLCDLYYPPYNFTRSGCKGCPYSLDLAKDLEILEIFKTIAKRKGAISTALYIEDNRPKTNIIIKLDTANDKEILCNEKIKQWLEGETK